MQSSPKASALRVLLVEDSETDAKLIVRALRGGARDVLVQRVETAEQMRAALTSHAWDVVISDWSLPQFSARQALSLAHQLQARIPFIIVSGTVGEVAAVEAMRAGARDYVLKDNLARLAPAVERELREYELRLKAEHALRASQQRFERLSASGVIGICIIDDSGALREANDACLSMLGYSQDELTRGVSWEQLTPASCREVSALGFGRLYTQGVAPAWEQELLRQDGTRVSVLVGMATLEDRECIAILIDVTERKVAEERLRHSEEQLRQVQKMEAIGSLAGGIAHDLNNVLTVVLSYSALLAHELDPSDPHRADLNQIHEAGERAAKLTQHLLAFSRRQVLQPKIVRLEALLAATEPMLKRLIGEDVELRVTTASTLWNVRVDPSQIDQVILNLAVNARDAMPRGGALSIHAENVRLAEPLGELRQGEYVRIDVRDTGLGMDQATQSRMFEPFFTTKDAGHGTGLGLATVFGIVRQSGGSISVRSAPGAGTTIGVFLPRARGQTQGVSATRPRRAAPRGTETILLVEDDLSVRALARGVLVKQGYRVIEACDGTDAVQLSARHPSPIDLLITDVVMPKLSGPEVAARLSSDRDNLRVLFMSGYAHDAAVQHGLFEEHVHFLPKPFTPEQLAHEVRAVLDAAQSA